MLPELLKEWENFAVITGSAAGALTGLLFVAVSLNRDRIVAHAGLQAEAAQTLVLFILALLLTVLLVIPGMSAATLGVVLVAVSLAAGLTLIMLDRNQPGRTRDEARGLPRTNGGERPEVLGAEPGGPAVPDGRRDQSQPVLGPVRDDRPAACCWPETTACTGWRRRCCWPWAAG